METIDIYKLAIPKLAEIYNLDISCSYIDYFHHDQLELWTIKFEEIDECSWFIPTYSETILIPPDEDLTYNRKQYRKWWKVYDHFKKHALEPTYPIDIFELVKPELARIYKLDEKKAHRVWNYVNVEDLETDIKALYSEKEAEKEFEIARKWWQAYFYFRIYTSCKLSD